MSKTEKEAEVDKGLTDINEDEPVNYDSDGRGRSRSPSPGKQRRDSSVGAGSVGSGGAASTGSSGKAKRRSWKKPKDKPKRPLSAYNIFFKHERSRIVEGKTEDATPEETIRSIEIILATSRDTRRHRKTHGRISFGDLARLIADKWKGISQDNKYIFERYAELDMRRYRKEVQNWKDRKEAEALHGPGGSSSQEGSATSNSFSDSISDYSEGAASGVHDPWAPRMEMYDNFNNSFSSVESEVSFDQLPMQMQLQMMQHQQQRQLQMQAQMNNSGLNFHSSMPNLGRRHSDVGVPSFVQSGGCGGMGGHGAFGQSYDQKLSLADLGASNFSNMNAMMNIQQNQRMNAMNNSFSGRPSGRSGGRPSGFTIMGNSVQRSVPFTIGDAQMSGDFQQLHSSTLGFVDSPLDNERKRPEADPAFSFHEVSDPGTNIDPVPFDQVFPDDLPSGKGGDLGNYLSNLDLSNV